MQKIIIEKPYVPVPPYHGRFWIKILQLYLPRLLRKTYGVTKVECVNGQRIADSIKAGHGVLIAPNHCRVEDPLCLGILSRQVGSPFFIMTSWHAFQQDAFQAFLLPRVGAFSVYREGIDRVAVNTAVEILHTAERPLVIFPEGMISRANDRIHALLDGTSLIARTAAKKRVKDNPPGKVVVHPVALRYRLQTNIDASARQLLDEIEARLSWRKQSQLPLLDRVRKVAWALLMLKEQEYLNDVQGGDAATRLSRLQDAILKPLEDEWTPGRHDGDAASRVKRLRAAIVPDLAAGELPEAERQRRWKHLEDTYVVIQLLNYPPDYVAAHPTPERIMETLERFEEDLTDRCRVHGELHATVNVGTAIEVNPSRESRDAADPLLTEIQSQMAGMLGLALDRND
jgi:1-acyl-sn-glycerol-3-phosphate acyltransferase